MRLWSSALPLWLLAAPAAAEEGGGFLGLPSIFWKSANFVVFFGLMVYLLARPLSRYFRDRVIAEAVPLHDAA